MDAPPLDWKRLGIVAFVMTTAVVTNFVLNTRFREWADSFPFIGAAVLLTVGLCSVIRAPNWSLLPATVKGSLFLLSLVLSASLMPVSALPTASWQSTMTLGFVSAVFDNIPLTKLALTQGGYDWGMLAYSVGYGGSMVWFGSSAGVAISNIYPGVKSVGTWLRHGWHVTLAFILGFMALQLGLGFHPHAPHKAAPAAVHEAARP